MTQFFMVYQERHYGKWQDIAVFDCDYQKNIYPSHWREFNQTHRDYLQKLRETKNASKRCRMIFRRVPDDDS